MVYVKEFVMKTNLVLIYAFTMATLITLLAHEAGDFSLKFVFVSAFIVSFVALAVVVVSGTILEGK